jgi:uncharacterized FlaG/YvyC family protein
MIDGMLGQTVRAEAQQAPMPQPLPQRQTVRPPAVETAKPAEAKPARVEQREVREQISTQELAEMLHKLNLTFDLFEIEAEFSFDQDDNQVRVVVRNTRTNEVIRRIPAHDFQAQFSNFRDGVGLLIDSFL